jgi:hypothetical protein
MKNWVFGQTLIVHNHAERENDAEEKPDIQQSVIEELFGSRLVRLFVFVFGTLYFLNMSENRANGKAKKNESDDFCENNGKRHKKALLSAADLGEWKLYLLNSAFFTTDNNKINCS